jgi:hypothetical protein
MKQLCERVAHEDVHANFSFHFFKIQNMWKMNFKIEGACPCWLACYYSPARENKYIA